MGKYNFPITKLDLNSAHGKVLSQIRPGSTVLECGCASGYMTRYMKEQLGCQVYIVEQDGEDYAKALRYATGGYNGDLDEDCWDWFMTTQCICDTRVDYVLFADVLEHLRNPLNAVKRAAGYMKMDGRMIVSIPYICLKDIILKLIDDRWDYTQYGLLDSTHVHFWGGNNVSDFFREAGLRIESTGTVTIPTGRTEQLLGRLNEQQRKTADILKRIHPTGEVFQYVFTLKKE